MASSGMTLGMLDSVLEVHFHHILVRGLLGTSPPDPILESASPGANPEKSGLVNFRGPD